MKMIELWLHDLPGVKSFISGVIGRSLPAHEAHFIDRALGFNTGILLWLLLFNVLLVVSFLSLI